MPGIATPPVMANGRTSLLMSMNTLQKLALKPFLKIKPINRGVEISLPVVRETWKKAVGVVGGGMFIVLGSAVGVLWMEIGQSFFSWLSAWEAILLASLAGIALMLVGVIEWLFLTQFLGRRRLIIAHTTVTLRDDSLRRKWTYHLDSIANVRAECTARPDENADLTRKHPPTWRVLFDAQPRLRTILCYEEISEDEAHRLVSVLSDMLTFHCHSVERIVFGADQASASNSSATLHNPDVAALTTPFFHLKQLDIHSAACDVYQLEQFLSYASTYIEPAYFKKHVAAYVYGDAERLPRHIRNTLTHLCKQVAYREQKEE